MTKRISIFGDSITWGKDDSDRGGWVNRLRHYFEVEEKSDIEVYNVGVSGDTTDDLLKRFTPECEARNRKDQVILFAIGINDSLHYINQPDSPKVPLDRFQSNLRKLIDDAKVFSDTIAFIGLTIVDESKMPRKEEKYWANDRIKKYNEVLKNICMESNIPFLEMLDIIDIKDLPDGLHPDSTGHEKMFQRIKEFILSNNILD